MTKKLISLATKIIILSWIIINVVGLKYGRRQLRIINGTDTFDYPFAVVLIKIPFFSKTCTAALIASSWVITASHCVRSRKVPNGLQHSKFKVMFGNLTRLANETDQLRNVLSIYHNMNVSKYPNDIGLLKIQCLESIKPVIVSSVDYASLVGKRTRILGVGSTLPDKIYLSMQYINNTSYHEAVFKDKTRPTQTMEAVVVKCRSPSHDGVGAYNSFGMICLRSLCSQGQRITFGDSGGPLLYRGKLIGVAAGDTLLTNTMFYTAVSPFIDWIHYIVTNTK